MSLEDDSLGVCQSTSVNVRHIIALEHLVKEDKQITVLARRLLKLLRPKQKLNRLNTSCQLQELLARYGDQLWQPTITTVKTWISYFNHETESQSKNGANQKKGLHLVFQFHQLER